MEQSADSGVYSTMILRNHFTAWVLVAAFFVSAAAGQEIAKSDPPQRPTWTRVDPLGGVTLPKGFRYRGTKNFPDAWIGVIESEDRKFVINFAAGMAGLDRPAHNVTQLIWDKADQVKIWPDKDPVPLTISLWKIKDREYIEARVNWAKFSAYVKDASEKNNFISIAYSYRSFQQFIKQSSKPAPYKTS